MSVEKLKYILVSDPFLFKISKAEKKWLFHFCYKIISFLFDFIREKKSFVNLFNS